VVIFAAIGLVAIVAGVAMIHPPSAFVVGGCFVVAIAALMFDDGTGRN